MRKKRAEIEGIQSEEKIPAVASKRGVVRKTSTLPKARRLKTENKSSKSATTRSKPATASMEGGPAEKPAAESKVSAESLEPGARESKSVRETQSEPTSASVSRKRPRRAAPAFSATKSEEISKSLSEKTETPLATPAKAGSSVPKQPAPPQLAREISKSPVVREPPISQQLASAVKELAAEKHAAKLPFEIPKILLEGDEPTDEPTSGPGRKFVAGSTDRERGATATEQALPEVFGSGKLTLTARDPRCLYVHWDLTAEQQREYNNASAQYHLFVRVRLQNSFGPVVSEAAVSPESRYLFLQVPQASATYVAELGMYLSNREWISVASSNSATTPPETYSMDRSVRFGELPPPKSSAFRQPDEPRLTWAAPVPSTGPEAEGYSEQPQRSASYVAPQEELTAFPIQWTGAQERALEEIINLTVARQEWFDSLQLVEMLESRRAARELLPVTPHLDLPKLDFPAPSSAELISQAPEVETISSPFGGEQKLPRRDFWFNVNAELIVYGATEPTARVTIGGRPIKLRPDGTFSYRFALPDGHYQLAAEATSVDDEVRRADLKFQRGTAYLGDVGRHPQDESLKIPAAENVA